MKGSFCMPITEILERNAREFGNDVALVEVNPEIRETRRVTWKEYELIEPNPVCHYRREITWSVFNEKANRLLSYKPTRKIYGKTYEVAGESGVHWSPKTEHGSPLQKYRRTITNPFLLPEKVGVRYHSKEALTTGHLLTMIGNAKRIAAHMTIDEVVTEHYPAMHALLKDGIGHREAMSSRQAFLSADYYMQHLLEDI